MLYLIANLQSMFSSGTICIGGFPGIGSVGKVAADYLATALDCTAVESFFSRGFPAQVVISGNIAHLLQAELKCAKGQDNLYILSGDAQPLNIKEMYILAGEIMESLRSRGVTDMITLAAYVGSSSEKVVGACCSNETGSELEKNGIPHMHGGAIGGINGLLAGMAPFYGMQGCCILGTTSGDEPVDLRAANSLLLALKQLLNLDISLASLEIEETEQVSCDEEIDMNYR